MILSKQVVKYIIVGGSVAVINLVILYFLTEFMGLWYLLSTVLAFLIAFLVSFTLQKFWTFRNSDTKELQKQFYVYFAVAIINLGLNTSFVYFLVEYGGLWYILAQVIAGATIALESFIIYKFFIFKTPKKILIKENY